MKQKEKPKLISYLLVLYYFGTAGLFIAGILKLPMDLLFGGGLILAGGVATYFWYVIRKKYDI